MQKKYACHSSASQEKLMQDHALYLSPAFEKRAGNDVEVLKTLDATSGFSLFWLDVVRPILEEIGAKRILEVGADQGGNTRLVIEYCKATSAYLTVVDPMVTPELQKVVSSYEFAEILQSKSHTAIPQLVAVPDAVLLQGDLNYYTALKDLELIEELSARHGRRFPLVFVKTVGWPYARRDMYYDPEGLPDGCVHEHRAEGMSPWSCNLVAGAFNSPFRNALTEGGRANGVLAAVEAFLGIRKEFRLLRIPVHNGLGILYDSKSEVSSFLEKEFSCSQSIFRLMETIEIARLNSLWSRCAASQPSKMLTCRGVLRNLKARLLKRLFE